MILGDIDDANSAAQGATLAASLGGAAPPTGTAAEPPPLRRGRTLSDVPTGAAPAVAATATATLPSTAAARRSRTVSDAPPAAPAKPVATAPSKPVPAVASVPAPSKVDASTATGDHSTCTQCGSERVVASSFEQLKATLDDAGKAKLYESMVLHNIPPDHPVMSIAAERILMIANIEKSLAAERVRLESLFDSKGSELITKLDTTSEKLNKSGRVIKFYLSPYMSAGILFVGIALIATLAWTIGVAAHPRLHEQVPVYPLMISVGLAVGTIIGALLPRRVAAVKTRKASAGW